jgi:hypothetical protein
MLIMVDFAAELGFLGYRVQHSRLWQKLTYEKTSVERRVVGWPRVA